MSTRALASRILDAARAQGVTVTAAESCTAGMVAAALTDPAGASAMFERGFVTYSNVAKVEMVGVSPATLDAHGAVSEEVAAEMAQGARDRAGAAWAVAISGIAGPGGSDFKPEGRVCFALAGAGGTSTRTIDYGALGRDGVRRAATDHALRLLLGALEGR
ncbi:CinA family protein [Pseudaestuariivita atlantica]|uniref:Damage-inducible protein CinA n=1 Tax=Pseudaestuariivita atlantica TaxID=1317121 RepID=A0A0L1JNS9_9RHOB|nr:CinA family protein [Pseudaestuariivita atlantica]KNG93043.1 damage-inducible protein CinA [Pseudaestuariivita atlantica]